METVKEEAKEVIANVVDDIPEDFESVVNGVNDGNSILKYVLIGGALTGGMTIGIWLLWRAIKKKRGTKSKKNAEDSVIDVDSEVADDDDDDFSIFAEDSDE